MFALPPVFWKKRSLLAVLLLIALFLLVVLLILLALVLVLVAVVHENTSFRLQRVSSHCRAAPDGRSGGWKTPSSKFRNILAGAIEKYTKKRKIFLDKGGRGLVY